MKGRLVMIVAVVIACGAVAFSASLLIPAARPGPPVVHAIARPSQAYFLGVYAAGWPPDYHPVAAFAQAAGRRPDLIGYFSGWAQPFGISFARQTSRHGAVTLVQIDPTDASVGAIAAGAYDEYLRSYASSVRKFGHPVVIGFGHEMNAPWYPWGYRHVRAATFIAAWRHVVDLFRAEGADNVTWLWTVQADTTGTGPVAAWWPGAGYVTWVGIDGYYYRRSDTFASVFGHTIRQLRALTAKPVLLSETAVGPAAGQFAKIQDLFRGMVRYKTLGLVWFNIVQHDGVYHQDWRIQDNQAAVSSFRLAVRALSGPLG